MSEIPKTYEPQAIEERWYAQWLADGCFHADPASAKPAYSIVIPPPNVTGVLTLGHVLNNTIQDILARRARMQGKEVLWLPGTDHAGIATQTVVERTLKKQGVIRHRDDLGREKFLEKVWEWKDKHGGIIIQQLKKLGCSCDWERERFTMDPEYSRCVQRVFVDLYKKGLIYRGKRMVNWCPASLTALSDEEVEMKPQNGTMYHFKVEVAGLPGTFLTIATTRPETIPGDTAVAVNPKDPRYAHLIGQNVVRPLPVQIPQAERLIPIIGDDHVDFEFGTGVLKVTPAHDKADFEIGQRHGLAAVDIMNPDGTMNALAGETLVGLDRFEARNVAVDHLRELGVLVKEEPYQNNVGYSERADVPIEPRLSEQWFLQYPSVEQARGCVADGAMKFFPERWAKVYDHWLGGIQDWCISRQLWWGHRVPVWTLHLHVPSPEILPILAEYFGEFGCAEDVHVDPVLGAPDIAAGIRLLPITPRADEAVAALNAFYQEATFDPDRFNAFPSDHARDLAKRIMDGPASAPVTQDNDVLDTWFSSWLWPFATMGWPEKTDTLAKFYPTTDLVTGPDIIFFWVARMIMAGFEWMGKMPFRNVYFTGIIRDKQGRKMSKSLGNSPDPLDLIATYGADALRFGVMRSAPLGADILFDDKNVELGRNFCTKLWNAARFRQMQGGETEGEINPVLLTSDDKWILLRLNAAIREVSAALDEYRFSDAANALYRFFWSEYCDWYVETSKASLYTNAVAGVEPAAAVAGDFEERKANTLAVMDFVLAHTLRLMHPFLPFITEELWHGLGFHDDLPADQGGRTIMFAHWPAPLDNDFYHYYDLDPSAEEAANAKYETVNGGRALRRDANIASNKRVRFVLQSATPLVSHDSEVLRILLNAEPFEVVENYAAPRGTPSALTPLGTLFLPLEGLVDVAAERERLAKEIAKVEDELAKVRAKLANPAFAGKVPPAVLAEHQQRESAWAEKLAQLARMREALGEA
ncbi:MAG: valine--tRNA ligase [Chthoniobacter sp.]|nr:valine--tRNA ligase [Chthoniobacter sp.]